MVVCLYVYEGMCVVVFSLCCVCMCERVLCEFVRVCECVSVSEFLFVYVSVCMCVSV